jgi:hypothetical protein
MGFKQVIAHKSNTRNPNHKRNNFELQKWVAFAGTLLNLFFGHIGANDD